MSPETTSWIVVLLVGLIAGWLAGKIVRGRGFGVIIDIIVGLVGAAIGNWLLGGRLHVPTFAGSNYVDLILVATIGAVLLLLVIKLIRR